MVHLGCVSAPLLSPEQIQVTGDRLGLPSRYILHVGTLQPRKNLVRLIRVFGRLAQLKGNDDLCLVLAGKKGWMYEGIFKIVKKCSLEKKVIFLDFLDSAGLSAVYCAAEMFVFPSLYEGFGLPVLEAMSYGLPIAASNISSIPEVLGDAGLYFDPYDEEQMYEVILRLLQDKELRGLLGKRAEERAAGFSWTRCAQKTLDLYRRWTGTSL